MTYLLRSFAYLLVLLALPTLPGATQQALPWVPQGPMTGSGLGGNYGTAVDIDGATAIVGAFYGDGEQPGTGTAYMHQRSGNAWPEQQEIFAIGGRLNDYFGMAVAIDGDTAVVGAPGHGQAGAAYVFRRVGGTWSQSAMLLPPPPVEIAGEFGGAVAIDGGVIVVGDEMSRHAQPTNPFCTSGSAHVFELSAGTWIETALLLEPTPDCTSNFASSVAVQGTTILVGSNKATPRGTGAAFLFERNSSSWAPGQVLTVPSLPNAAFFGESVALESNVLVVGAPLDRSPCPTGGNCQTGSAFVYRKLGSVWNMEARILPQGLLEDDRFGYRVDISGDFIAIGAPYGDGARLDTGTAYVYRNEGQTWVLEQEVYEPNGVGRNVFGNVAIEGDALLVGDGEDFTFGGFAGSVSVYNRLNAAATTRNGGSNPKSYDADVPLLGSIWTATVDIRLTEHTFAVVQGQLAPAMTTLPGSQTLLIGGSTVFSLPPMPGPVATWTMTIPADNSLAGLAVYTQAAHFMGVTPFVLSNAIDLVLGF